jgi:preprotein translocase subunit YajC
MFAAVMIGCLLLGAPVAFGQDDPNEGVKPIGGSSADVRDANTPGDPNGQGDPNDPNAPAGGGNGGLLSSWKLPLILLGVLVVMFWFSSRQRRKQEKQRKEMISSLKKGDKVVTIGGVVGTVIEAKPHEITVKVDENNNVRMKFARWSIRGVGDEAKSEDPQQS